jgi:hypothetical protein
MKKFISRIILSLFIFWGFESFSQIDKKSETCGYLGLRTVAITYRNPDYQSGKISCIGEVGYVDPNSPAYNSGIEVGDIIVSINNKNKQEYGIRYLLMSTKPNQKITLEIARKNLIISKEEVVLTDWPLDKLNQAIKDYKFYKERLKETEEWISDKARSSFTDEKKIKLGEYLNSITLAIEMQPYEDNYVLKDLRANVAFKHLGINIFSQFSYVNKSYISDLDLLLDNFNKTGLSYQAHKKLLFIKISTEAEKLRKKEESFDSRGEFRLYTIDYSLVKNLFFKYLNLLNDTDKTLKLKITKLINQKKQECPWCGGKGKNENNECRNCSKWNNEYRSKVACQICLDTRKGKTYYTICGICKGTGLIEFYQSSKYSEIHRLLQTESERVKSEIPTEAEKKAFEEEKKKKVELEKNSSVTQNPNTPFESKPCSENTYNWDYGCKNNKIGLMNTILFGDEYGKIYGPETLTKLRNIRYLGPQETKITEDIYNNVLKLGEEQGTPQKNIEHSAFNYYLCDENIYDWDYGCKNNKIGLMNTILFGDNYGDIYGPALLTKLRILSYLSSKETKITQDIYNKVVKLGEEKGTLNLK